MAVKASATITLSFLVDIKATYRYYKLQSSTAAAPAKPTTNPPPTGWDDTEPKYTSGNTQTLYFVDLTVFANDTFLYSSVSKSSSYEAAKEAFNKAVAAQQAAAEAAKTATNYINSDANGLVIGNVTDKVLGKNIRIDTDSVDIRSGDDVLASYEANAVYIGKNNKSSIIDLCNGVAKLYNDQSDEIEGYNRLVIEAENGIELNTQGRIKQETYYSNGTSSARTTLHMKSYEPWSGEDQVVAQMTMTAWTSSGVQSYLRLQDGYATIGAASNTKLISLSLNAHADTTTLTSKLVFPNNTAVCSCTTEGEERSLIYMSGNNNTVIGYDNYAAASGNTNIYGNDVIIWPKTGAMFRPYYKSGDSIEGRWYGAGFVTSSGARVYFTVPLNRPPVGCSGVTVTSVNGLVVRQAGKYTHGSSSSVYVKPDVITAALSIEGNGVAIIAEMPATTNAVNNEVCGITASIKITFM